MALDLTGESLAFFAGMALIAIIFVILLFIAIYVYLGLAFTAIGRKAKLKTPELAWIPGIGPTIIAFQASKMHWWPWLLLIGLLIPFVNFLVIIAITAFAIMWQWKMFEAINKPGWWALLCLITPVNLVFYGIAAWGE